MVKLGTVSAIAAAFAVAGEALPSVLKIDLASIQNGAIVVNDKGFERLDEWSSNQSDKDSITMVGVLPEQWAAAPPRPTRRKSSEHMPAWLQAATLHRKADSFVAMRDESDENMVIYVVPPFFTQENRLVLADNGEAIDIERKAFAFLYTICSKIIAQSHGALSALQIDELSRIATPAKVLAETVPTSSGGFVQPELLMLISNTDGTDEAVSVALSPLDIAQAGNSHLRLVEASRESALGAPESPLGSLDKTVQGMAVVSTGSGRFGGGSWQGPETRNSALAQSGSIAALRTPRASAACGAFSAVTIAALGSSGKLEEQANLVNRFVNTLPAVGAVTRSAGARAIGGLQPPVAIAGLNGESSTLTISSGDGLDEASGDQVVRYDGRYSIEQLQQQAKSAERAITAMDNQALFQAGRERLVQFREKFGEKVRRDVVDLASHAYQEHALTDGKNQPIRKIQLDKLIEGARHDAKKQLHAGLGSKSSIVEDDMLKDLGLKEQAARTALDQLREQYRKELEAAVDGVVAAQITKAKNKDVPVEATAVDEIDRETLSLAGGKVSADAYAWLVEERGESSSSAMLEAWPRIKVAGQTLKRRSDDARVAASKRVISRAKKGLKNSKLAGQGSGGVAIVSSNQIKETTTAVLQTIRESVERDCRGIAGGCSPNTLQKVEDAARQMSSKLRRNVEKAVREEVRQRFLVAQTTAQQELPRVVEQSFNELLSGDAVKGGLAASLQEAQRKAEAAQRLYVEELGFSSAPVEDASRMWAGTQEETIRSHVKQYEMMLEGAFREADIQIAAACAAAGEGLFVPEFWTIDQVIDYTRSLLRENNVIAAKFIESGALETRIRAKIVEDQPGVVVMRNSGLFWIVLVVSTAALVGVVALGILAGGESKRFGVLAGPILALSIWAAGGSAVPVLAPIIFSGGTALAGVAAVVLADRNAASYTAAATGVILLAFGVALHLTNSFAHEE